MFNKNTGSVQRVTEPEVKNLFIHTIDELKKIIDDSIKKNMLIDISEFINSEISIRNSQIIIALLKDRNIFRYCGEAYDELPSNAEPGQVWSMKGNFYLKLEAPYEWQQILTYENAEELLRDYYSKEEIDAKIADLLQQIQDIRSYVDEVHDNIEEDLNGYVTKDAFIAKFSEYEAQINELRQEYESRRSEMIASWNDKVQEFAQWSASEHQRVAQIDEKYLIIKEIYDSQMYQISSFIEDIDEQNRKIDELSQYLNSLPEILSGMQNEIDSYKTAYEELKAYADRLKMKLDELQEFDQSILELPDEASNS